MDKTKIFLTLLFILTISSLISAQNSTDNLTPSLTNNQDSIDYFKIRNEKVSTSCTKVDTFSVNMTLKNLLSMDTLKITNGLCDYYYDLGMNYYLKAALYKQDNWFYLAIASFNKCISIDSTRGDCYHNISLIYYFLKDIGKAKSYLVLYKKYTAEPYWDKEFIDRIEKEKDNK